MLISLIVGDPENSYSQYYIIDSNLTEAEMYDTYTQFFAVYENLEFFSKFCSFDNFIHETFYNALIDLGFNSILEKADNNPLFYIITEKDFIDIYLFIIKHMRADFSFNFIEIPEFHLGGEGLCG